MTSADDLVDPNSAARSSARLRPLLHRLTPTSPFDGRCRAVEAAACDPQTGNAASVERRLPAGQLLIGEQVALTRFLASDDAGARSDDDGRLAARRPPLCVRWGQDEGGLALIQPAGCAEFNCAGSPVIIGVPGSGYRLRVLHGMNCTWFRSNRRAAQANGRGVVHIPERSLAAAHAQLVYDSGRSGLFPSSCCDFRHPPRFRTERDPVRRVRSRPPALVYGPFG
jgi:hypothetical protein